MLCDKGSYLFCVRAEYSQESVDAALADFASLAGEENAAIIRPYVAAVLGRSEPSHQPAGDIADPSATPKGEGEAAGAATVTPQQESGAAIDGTTAQPDTTAQPGTTAQPPSAANLTPAAADAAPSQTPPKRRPAHVTLNPILEKELRTAVHKFFREETRLPVFRTETAQERKTKSGVVIFSPLYPLWSDRNAK